MQAPFPLLNETPVNLTDATIALLLAAKIHGTDAAVQATAKRCSQRLSRSKRDLMFTVVNSREPLKLVEHIAQHLDLD
ncbi:TPA: hypothetical protein L4T44_000710 [Pseudomonas aeruginosa]|nr:hypothetical protein [Pseudomonas aeruginosa]HBO3861923.1 hypothetical protein [Pseudomonas aeruginosa]